MKQYVITISRQFGSMGRSIAQALAQQLNIDFYDRDIVEETARRMGLPVSVISDTEENAKSVYFRRIYPLGMGVPNLRDEIFLVQKNIIRGGAQPAGRNFPGAEKHHPGPGGQEFLHRGGPLRGQYPGGYA